MQFFSSFRDFTLHFQRFSSPSTGAAGSSLQSTRHQAKRKIRVSSSKRRKEKRLHNIRI
jgi:hypothetical protein